MALLNRERNQIPSPDSGLRQIAFLLGLTVFLIGLALSGFLFVNIARALNDPTPYSDSVDRWEFFVRGRGPVENFVPEPGDTARLNETQNTPLPAQQTTHENELKFVDAFMEKGARWSALGLITMFVLALCSIAAGTTAAGARLMRAGLRPALVYSDDDVEEHRDTGLTKRPRV